MAAFRAAVVGGQGVDLRDAGHIGHQRGAHAAPGAHQIARLIGFLHQLDGGHIDHVVAPGTDVVQLLLHAVHHQLGGLVPVEPVHFAVAEVLQLLFGILDLGREKARGQGGHLLDQLRDAIGVLHHHFPGGILPQVGKFLQHLRRGLEIQGQGLVAVGELVAQEDAAELLLVGLQEMHVPRGHHGLIQQLPQLDHLAVVVPQLLLPGGGAAADEEGVVAERLDLNIVVKA